MKKEICHVCKKEKKPYIVFLNDNVLSYISYQTAREDGPICEKCDRFFAMTGELREPTDEEYKIAKEAVIFSNMLAKWWVKESKDKDDDNYYPNKDWPGTVEIRKWYRKECAKKPKPIK